MIMAIGGNVAYIREIKASEALVCSSGSALADEEISLHHAIGLIPIGQILFIAIPNCDWLGTTTGGIGISLCWFDWE